MRLNSKNYLIIDSYNTYLKIIMVNLQKAKIYKLVNADDETLYIGSTCQSLAVRMRSHRYYAERKLTVPIYKYINETCGVDNVFIKLVCNYPCDSKEDLIAEERRQCELIGLDNLKNVRLPGRSFEEYYRENKQIVLERNKNYYEKHKERINKKIVCDCGSSYSSKQKKKHQTTKRHTKYLIKKLVSDIEQSRKDRRQKFLDSVYKYNFLFKE